MHNFRGILQDDADELAAALDAGFLEDVIDVVLHRMWRDEQFPLDFLVTLPFQDHLGI